MSETTAAAPRFGEVAARLAENGYQPLPLYFGQKNPCAGEGWSNYQFAERDLKRFAKAGTGILCGKVIALDIDVRDAALAGQLEAMAEERFGPAPRRIGQPPKVLRILQAEQPFGKFATRGYRLPGDAPEDKSHRVEILASGQQFVAYNQHPDTGRPYEWNGAGDPLSVPIGLLPTISETGARDFVAAADELLARHGRPVGRLVEADQTRVHEPNEELRASDPALLREALAALPNDDVEFDDATSGSWIHVLYATKGALGDEGLADFLKWSAKSAKDVPSFSAHEYTAAKPRQLGAGTIYYLAQRHGWQRPQPTSAPESWPDPVNLFAELTAAPFEAADLPEELATYPALYAQQTGIDASIALTAAVASAAAAIPDQIQIVADPSSDWFAQPRLWLLVIGAPGAGKSPAQRAMLDPLWKLHSELDAEWRAAVKTLPEEEPKPPRPRVIVGDTTLEALSDVLVDNPRGVLVATDEFSAWLGALDQYKSGGIGGRDRGEWLRLFDGGPHQVERVKRGSLFVPNWGASILTATTPAAMRGLTRHLPEDGLLQRFLIVLAGRQSVASHPPERAQIEAERARYVQTLRRLWSLAPRAHNGVVPLSVNALERFAAWRIENRELQEALGGLDSALEAHVAKYPTLALRLALVFHCTRTANLPDERARDPAAWPIALETLERALAFLRRASRHALALYLGRRGGSPAFELARNVARYILARPIGDPALQRRDVLRHVIAFRNADEPDQGATLRLLVDLGWIRETEGGYQKAQPTRYAVNPGLLGKFAALAERERDRRATVRERLAEAIEQRRSEEP